MASPIVDCQTHLFPTAYAELLTRNTGTPVTRRDGTTYLSDYGTAQFRLDREAYSVPRKLQDMDAAGVDVAVVSVNMPGPEQLDEELAELAARVCNDALAEACVAHPDRMVGLACLPWQLPEAALSELSRAHDQLGMRGVMLYSHVAGGPVDIEASEPIFAELACRGLPLVMHPSVPPWADDFADYTMVPMLGLMVDHSLATLRLVLSGVLERHPTLQLVQPHCGGVLPYLWGRIRHQTEVLGRGVDRLASPAAATALYRRVYLDTASPWPPALRLAYEWAGADQLLFSSDHPWVKIQLLLDCLAELGLPTDVHQRILGGNACQLFAIT